MRFFLLILLLTLLPCFTDVVYPKPGGQRAVGFTICGIKPGITFREARSLLKAWRVDVIDIDAGSRTVFLKDGHGRHLLVRLIGPNHREFVEQLTYFPVNKAFSLELNGKVLLVGLESVKSVHQKLGINPSIGDKIVLNGGNQLILRLNLSRQVLQSATLIRNGL